MAYICLLSIVYIYLSMIIKLNGKAPHEATSSLSAPKFVTCHHFFFSVSISNLRETVLLWAVVISALVTILEL